MIVLAMAVSPFVFAGGQGESSQSATGGQVTITMSSWLEQQGVSRDTMKEMISRFEKANPNTTVQMIDIPFEQTVQQLLVAVNADNAPDVMHLNPVYSAPFAARGALADLKPYFSAKMLDQIPKGAYEAGVFDGKLETVPWQIAPIVVLGSKKLLKEAGLPEEIPNTWADFQTAVQKISELGPGIFGFGARTDKSANSAQWFLPVLWGFGAQFADANGKITLDTPQAIDALNWYREIGTKKYTPIGMGIPQVRDLFAQGKVGFIFDGPWMQKILRDTTGLGKAADDTYIVGPMPKAADGKRYAIANNHVLAVSSQSKHKQAAVTLIKFLTQDPSIANYYFDQMQAIPVYSSILSGGRYANSYTQAFIQSASYADPLPSKNPHFTQALELMAGDIQAVLLGGSAQKAAADMQQKVSSLYGQ